MRKLFASLLVLLISFETSASTLKNMALSNAIDEFTYALTVEWDQKDQVQYQNLQNQFKKEISDIVMKEGLTGEQVMLAIKGSMPDPKVAQEIEAKLKMVPDSEKINFLQQLISEQNNHLYKKGASWNGQGIMAVGILVGALALITVLALVSAGGGKGDCVNYEDQEHYDVVSGSYYTTTYCAEYASN